VLRKWNSARSKRLPSFHLETRAGNVFNTLSTYRPTGPSRFFEWGPAGLTLLTWGTSPAASLTA
jgi:hypothetical protein